MSMVPKETVEVIAQSVGIPSLAPEVAIALAPDVEYRVREIIQEAIKCMRHSRRTVLSTEDIDSALALRNVEPLYGFSSGDPLRFKRALGHKDLFYIDDREVDFKEIIEAPLPKAPLDTTVLIHWLAIEGVQPAVPENPPIDVILAPSESTLKRNEHGKEDAYPVDIKLPVKHILSRELQMYFDKIAELILTRSESLLFKKALASLATDSGIHPLVPYFSYFIADEVARNLGDLSILIALMRILRSLLSNPHIHIEPYLHQLMPSIITCLVAKRLGNKLLDNHWELRDFAANLAASVCRRFGHVYHNLQSRLTTTLLRAFLDPSKALTQHYGAVQGLSALGPSSIRLLILPNLEKYMQLLEPEMQLDKQKNEMKRKEAWRVYGALLCAAGKCLHDRLRLFPRLLSPPNFTGLKSNMRVVTVNPNKRMGSTDPSSSPQAAIKNPAMEMASNSTDPVSLTSGMQGAVDAFTSPPPSTAGAPPSSSGQTILNEGIPSTAPRDGGSSGIPSIGVAGGIHGQTISAVLRQAWKDDLDAGLLLTSLHEIFGEAIFSFVQPPETLFVL